MLQPTALALASVVLIGHHCRPVRLQAYLPRKMTPLRPKHWPVFTCISSSHYKSAPYPERTQRHRCRHHGVGLPVSYCRARRKRRSDGGTRPFEVLSTCRTRQSLALRGRNSFPKITQSHRAPDCRQNFQLRCTMTVYWIVRWTTIRHAARGRPQLASYCWQEGSSHSCAHLGDPNRCVCRLCVL